ncbi:MAG: hypothetical protein KKC71_02465 [Chloroflexi bacterium]|nr:hypothetical protein [Chloroflexota bacterium]
MAEIRCPMCAKPNPEELEACNFCGARLKPLVSAELERALPSWLRNLRGQDDGTSAAEAVKPFATEGLPPAPEAGSAPQPADVKLPDWLAGFESGSEEEVPEWLADIRAEPQPQTGTSAEGLTAEEEPRAQPEGADWLGGLRQGEEEAQARLDGKAPPQRMAAFVEPPFPSEPGEAALLEVLPGWFSDLKSESAPAQPEADRVGVALSLSKGAAQKKPVAAAAEPVSAPSEELPDWLLKLQEESKAPTHELPQIHIPFEESPGWLEKLQASAYTEPERPSAPIIAPEAAAPAEDSQANFPMEVPDWLSTLGPEEAEEAAAGKSAQKAEALEPGELPSWVQAMRPVEAVMAESEVPQEKAGEESAAGGPLAGLSGVLPLGPGLGPLRKPPAYSSKLQVTESQKRHAASLERLVSTESEPRPIKGQSRMPSARLLRWVIALVLILAASLPIVTGIQIVPGAIYPAESGPTRELINGLGTNSPVLVVFDYEPALSGELEAAAAPVIDHLLFKAPRLAIISTSPTGPILAERFLKTTQASHRVGAARSYQRSDPVDQRGQGYVNLGYLAGGPAGVLGFAQNPPVTAANSFEGTPAWQMPPLQGVQNLSDFAALIILTDNADTGRIWIEQAGPYLKNSPLLMIISAQAEPMLRPYYDSGQIKGLVTGLAGGKAYEQANEPAFPGPGLARRYWDAFSLSLFLAEMMILIGGLWGAMAAWRARRNKPEEGD